MSQEHKLPEAIKISTIKSTLRKKDVIEQFKMSVTAKFCVSRLKQMEKSREQESKERKEREGNEWVRIDYGREKSSGWDGGRIHGGVNWNYCDSFDVIYRGDDNYDNKTNDPSRIGGQTCHTRLYIAVISVIREDFTKMEHFDVRTKKMCIL